MGFRGACRWILSFWGRIRLFPVSLLAPAISNIPHPTRKAIDVFPKMYKIIDSHVFMKEYLTPCVAVFLWPPHVWKWGVMLPSAVGTNLRDTRREHFSTPVISLHVPSVSRCTLVGGLSSVRTHRTSRCTSQVGAAAPKLLIMERFLLPPSSVLSLSPCPSLYQVRRPGV